MSVVINTPKNGAELNGTVNVTATFNGQNFNIATCTFNGQQLASDSSLPLSFNVDTTKVSDGNKTLIVAVKYKRGTKFRWEKAQITVIVKNIVTPPPPSTWAIVASEHQQFTLAETKEVRYGIEPTWAPSKVLAAGTYTCNNALFDDPIVGTIKQCQVRSTNQPPPPYVPSNPAFSQLTQVILS